MTVTTRNALRNAINGCRLTELKPLAYHLRLSVRGNKPQYIDALQSYLDDAASDPQVLRARLVEFAAASSATSGPYARLSLLSIESLVTDYTSWHAAKMRAANPQAAWRPPPPVPQPSIGRAPSSLQERLANIQRAAAAPVPQRGASVIDTPWGSVGMAECKFRIDPYFELVAPLAMRKLSAGNMADCIDFKLGQAHVRMLMDEPGKVHLALLVTYQDALYLSAKHTVKLQGHGPGHAGFGSTRASPCYALLESRLMSSVAVNGTQIKFHKNPSYLIDKGKADKVHPILLTANARRDTSTQTVAITTQVSPSSSLVGLVAVVRQFTAEQVLERIQRSSIAERIAEIQAANQPKDDDDDDFDLDIKVAVTDPVLMTRITTPLRSTSCKHADCCDALTFLRQNAQTPTYTCPHCNHEVGSLPKTMDFDRVFAEPLGSKLMDRLRAEKRKPCILVGLPVLERLRVDEHFADMLCKVGQDVEQVQLQHVSGEWVIPRPKPVPPACVSSPVQRASSQRTRESTPILVNPTTLSTRSSSPALVVSRASRTPSLTPALADRVVVELLDSDDDSPSAPVVRRRSVPRPRPVLHSSTPPGAAAATGLSEVVDLMSDSDDDARVPVLPTITLSPPRLPTPPPPPPAPAPAIANGQSRASSNPPPPPPVPSSPLPLTSPLRRPRSATLDDDDENDAMVRMSPYKRRRRNVIGDGEGDDMDVDMDKVPRLSPLAGAAGTLQGETGQGTGARAEAGTGTSSAGKDLEKEVDKEPLAGAAPENVQTLTQLQASPLSMSLRTVRQCRDQLERDIQAIPVPAASASASVMPAPAHNGLLLSQAAHNDVQRRIAQLERDNAMLRARLEIQQRREAHDATRNCGDDKQARHPRRHTLPFNSTPSAPSARPARSVLTGLDGSFTEPNPVLGSLSHTRSMSDGGSLVASVTVRSSAASSAVISTRDCELGGPDRGNPTPVVISTLLKPSSSSSSTSQASSSYSIGVSRAIPPALLIESPAFTLPFSAKAPATFRPTVRRHTMGASAASAGTEKPAIAYRTSLPLPPPAPVSSSSKRHVDIGKSGEPGSTTKVIPARRVDRGSSAPSNSSRLAVPRAPAGPILLPAQMQGLDQGLTDRQVRRKRLVCQCLPFEASGAVAHAGGPCCYCRRHWCS